MTDKPVQLKRLIEDLTGQAASDTPVIGNAASLLDNGSGLGLSQFNELLLLMDFDRIEPAFFQYLVDGSAEIKPKACIESFDKLKQGVERFQKLALLGYGNVKYGFKQLSADPKLLWEFVCIWRPITPEIYKNRHKPILPVDPIDGKETYFLGYIVEKELKERLKNPDDKKASDAEKKRQKIVEQGIRNQDAYLVSDHLDVYVATSMRKPHEYLMVNNIVGEIFKHKELSDLKLRWFDPTQAYCKSRIDKGLAEGLMLKRAQVTLYFVQESDTIGKDSELAATLAQGKPVVAYIPEGDNDFVENLLLNLKELDPDRAEVELILGQLQIFEPQAAWEDSTVREWLANSSDDSVCKAARKRLKSSVKKHYDKRAKTLKDIHPLGIQVCLNSGVANGVLVVRTVEECAQLIHSILLNKLKFTIDPVDEIGKGYLILRETISGCVFRVMTGDVKLTNTFWNFYLK